MIMWTPSSEIRNAAESSGRTIKESSESAPELRKAVGAKFASLVSNAQVRLFERLIPNSLGVQADVAISRMQNQENDDGIITFFEAGEDDAVFEFKSFADFSVIYKECALFTIYLTNRSTEYVVCFTEEHTVLVVGSVESWLAANSGD